MNKKLVIYYSFEGSTKFIAQTIAQTLKADLLELKPVKEIHSKGFMKYFWGGRQVVMKIKPPLETLDKNPNDYDVIIIGTPVWAWSFAPPLLTFFSQIKLTNKKIALFCCHEGQSGKTLAKMEKKLLGNQIIGKKDFLKVFANEQENMKIAEDWARQFISEIND